MTPPLAIGSLCTGYGGLDLAAAEVFGGRPAWMADPDPGAAAVLAHHWPHVPNLGDITIADFRAVPPVDVLCAGFPCQDLSYAGRGAGIREGTRSGLWHHIADAVGVVRPRYLVLENVAAIVARRPGLDVRPRRPCPARVRCGMDVSTRVRRRRPARARPLVSGCCRPRAPPTPTERARTEPAGWICAPP